MMTSIPFALPTMRVPRMAVTLIVALLLGDALVFAADGATVRVERKSVDIGYTADAIVEAVRQTTISAQMSGRVIELRADAGQTVKQGEVMMRLDAREAAGGDAAAQANLLQAKASVERTRNLFSQKYVSQAALDQAEAAYKAAQGLAGASGASYSHANVSAPIAGVVAQRHLNLGDMAAPGVPLFTVYEPKALRVIVSIPQYKLAEVRRAVKARIEFPELRLSVEATKIELLPAVDTRTHTATARLYLPDGVGNEVKLYPGMSAKATFAVGQAEKLTVPTAAVVRRGEVTAVYVMDAAAVPRLRQIRLGEAVANGDLEVLSGLDSGDNVSLDPIKAGIAAGVAARRK